MPAIGRRVFELSPALPTGLTETRQLSIRGLRFAGHEFDVQLQRSDAATRVVLEYDRPVTLSHAGERGTRHHRHEFSLENGRRHIFELSG